MHTGARVVLLGSQVRNDAREDSDWDILIPVSYTHLGSYIFLDLEKVGL